ncbi:MAG: prolyl oligopeptidase family serine peptidase [Pirellulales bacterium]
MGIPDLTVLAKDFENPVNLFEAREFTDASDGKLNYRLLVPQNYDPVRKYPLVLFLHGAGERGDDNERQLVHGAGDLVKPDMRKRYPAFVVAPQCPEGKKWVEVPWEAASHSLPEQASEPLTQVLKLLDDLPQEFSIDADRLYVTGLSMGGYGTWDLLARQPELIAAAIPICGGGDPEQVVRFKDIPLWAFHGDQDEAVKVERSREMITALQAAGGQPIYTEYEGVGHNSWADTYANRAVWDWLFAQRRQRLK